MVETAGKRNQCDEEGKIKIDDRYRCQPHPSSSDNLLYYLGQISEKMNKEESNNSSVQFSYYQMKVSVRRLRRIVT